MIDNFVANPRRNRPEGLYVLNARECLPSVLVLEREALGSQSSSAAADLLAPIRPFASLTDPLKHLQLASLARFPSLIAALEEESGLATEYAQTGTLRLLPPEKIAPVRDWSESWKRAGFSLELLSPEEACQREPLLFSGLAGALFIADEAQVTPIRLVQAYAQAARNRGAIFFEHANVVAFQRAASGQRITGVTTASGEIVLCEHLILAPGVWSAEIGQHLGITLPVSPVRGEIVALHQPSPPLQHICFDEGLFDVIWRKIVTTQVPGSQAMGNGDPSKTAVIAASRERPCFFMVER